ncbi:glutamyl-tRNA reductase [Vallitalea okinawensis]|uniref:glutamyl-tRNA reductase n=1 Tax=Vallitalea okinawensis TaxID=2078660 RepID=UPI000CFA864D|nr:glutamyl-tRNA reductase [Vallitalea okinawensis]
MGIYFSNFYCISLNYKYLQLEERELIVKEKFHMKIQELLEKQLLKGYVHLSTCLRLEFYLECDQESFESAKCIFVDYMKACQIFTGVDAVEYLYRVACGFESVIMGEDEILSQLKKACVKATEQKTTSKLLNVLMNKAIALGKKIRTVSRISHNSQSLPATVVRLLRSKYGKALYEKRVLIIGIGDLAQDIMKLLIGETADITICNRNGDKLHPILKQYAVKGIDYKDKYTFIPDSDIIISATAAPHPILFFEDMKDYLVDEKERVLLDLAVPRDIESEVKTLKGVDLLNLDDCWEVYNQCLKERQDYMKNYYFILQEYMNKTLDWCKYKEKIS